jgi:hypothetical protein
MKAKAKGKVSKRAKSLPVRGKRSSGVKGGGRITKKFDDSSGLQKIG